MASWLRRSSPPWPAGPDSSGTLAVLRARNELPSRLAAQGPMAGCGAAVRAGRSRSSHPAAFHLPRPRCTPLSAILTMAVLTGHAARYLRPAELYNDSLTRAAIALPRARRAQGGPPARGLRRAVHPARRCSRLARCNHWYYWCRGRVMTGCALYRSSFFPALFCAASFARSGG